MEPWKKTLYIMWVAQFSSLMGFSFVLPFMPFYVRQLGVEGDANIAWWAGIASAATSFTLTIFSPIWGHVADRHGRKVMVLRSMFGGAVVLLLTGFARNITELCILRALQGAVTGTMTASMALVASTTPSFRSGYALGLMQAAAFAGSSMGPYLGGKMWDLWGSRAPFLVASCVLVAAGTLVKFGVKENFRRHTSRGKGHPGSFAEVFAATGFLVAVLVLFQIQFGTMARQPVFVLFIEQLYGTHEGVATFVGQLLAVTGLVAALSAGVFGRFSDRLGHRRLLACSTLVAGVVVLPQAFARNVWELAALQVVFGFAVAGIGPSANAIIRRAVPDRNIAKAYGISASLTSLGSGLGPLVGGYLAGPAGLGLRAPFLVTGAVLILTAGVAMVALKSSAPALDAAEAQVDVAPTIALPAPALDPEEGSPQA
jgi:DHA1 family multidrug resistance protein-like MFS transporter